MPLAAGALPSQAPHFAVPLDKATLFADAQTITATADLGPNTQLDFGGSAPLPGFGVGSGAGRLAGMWVLNTTSMDFSSADESYRFHLLASNDPLFQNGNVDL